MSDSKQGFTASWLGAARRNTAVLGVALLLAFLGLGYGFYYRAKVRGLQAQQVRLIGRGAAYLEGVLESALENVDNLGREPATLPEFVDRQPFLRLVSQADSEKEATQGARFLSQPGWLGIQLQTARTLERTVTVTEGASIVGEIRARPETTVSNESGLLVIRQVDEILDVDVAGIRLDVGELPSQARAPVEVGPGAGGNGRTVELTLERQEISHPWAELIPPLGEIVSARIEGAGPEARLRVTETLRLQCVPHVFSRGEAVVALDGDHEKAVRRLGGPLEVRLKSRRRLEIESDDGSETIYLGDDSHQRLASGGSIEIRDHCYRVDDLTPRAESARFSLLNRAGRMALARSYVPGDGELEGAEIRTEDGVQSLFVRYARELPLGLPDGVGAEVSEANLVIRPPNGREVPVSDDQARRLDALRALGEGEATFELVRNEDGSWRLEARGKRPVDRLTLAESIDGARERQPNLALERHDDRWSIALEPEHGSRGLLFRVDFSPILAGLPLGRQFVSYLVAEDGGGGGAVLYTQRKPGDPDLYLRSLAQLEELSRRGEKPAATATKAFDLDVFRTQQLGFGLLCQPVRLARSRTLETVQDSGVKLRLCGLINQREEQKQALTVAPQIAALLAILAFLGGLTWPFLRFFFLEPTERLRRSDIVFLLGGTFCSLFFLTSVLAIAHRAYDLEERMRQQLVELAEEVDERLTQDLGLMREQLVAWDRELCLQPVEEWRELLSRDSRQAGQGPRVNHLGLPPDDRDANDFSLSQPIRSAFRGSVFWVGDTGHQLAKATTHRRNTPFVRVDGREYFRRHAEGGARTWRGGPFHFEPIRSITTGQLSAAFSIPSEHARAGGTCKPKVPAPRVAVIEELPPSLLNPVVTPPFGFAVIDRSGQVLFHSNPRLAGFDNLLDQFSRPERLRALLQSEASGAIGSGYLGRPHRFYVGRSQELPWRIVTYFDREWPSTMAVESLLIGLVPGGIYVGLMAILLFCFRRRLLRNLWPRDEWAGAYVKLFSVYLALGGLLALCRYVDPLPVGMGFVTGVLLPATGFVFTVYYLGKQEKVGESKRKAAGSRALYRRAGPQLLSAYLLVGALLTLFGYLGGLAFSWAALAGLVLAIGGSKLTMYGLTRKARRAGERGDGDGGSDSRLEDSADDHRGYFLGFVAQWVLVAVLPAWVFFSAAWKVEIGQLALYQARSELEQLDERETRLTRLRRGDGLGLGGVDHVYRLSTATDWLHYKGVRISPALSRSTSNLPIYNVPSRELRYAGHWGSAAAARLRDLPRAEAIGEGSWSHGLWHYLLVIPFFAGLLYALTRWVRYAAHGLCFSGVDERQGKTPEELIETAERPLTAIVLTEEQARAVRGACKESVWKIDEQDSPPDTGGKPVFIEGLMEELGDAEERKKRLRRLESYLREDDAVAVLVAYSDPGEQIAEALRSGDPDADAQEELNRWRRALSQLRPKVVALPETAKIEDYYQLWTRLSGREQLALVQVADERVLNPRLSDIAGRLWQRGLLRRGPGFELRSESLRTFLKTNEVVAEVRRKEEREAAQGRKRWRLAAGVPLATLVAFLLVTQQGVLINTIALLTGAGGALAGAFRYVGTFASLKG